ncbi:phosphopyruvate hydratase [Burkholderia pseudomultivorans]|uniref:Enolase n=2 Tax=Burkholderia cepacia complex TaxID=87882 RepID=A0AAN0RZC9_9BURK|nr:phosphopyruvate hydratase [Burkholderia pseudomultivorans]AIO36668.1 phosphopyruvate hydratase [Burkholderia cenocepacia]KWF06380.1 enolase [Burkholderia pseudomultivorans]KWF64569.1 enolase [Burkholderia pseudomultivorans]MBF5009707.1 phosphopyruvate hydratase [Burkholderia pseudomultivorans]
MNSTITNITARRVWDSRGRPTVEVDVRLAGGAWGRGIAPAGASRGSNEAIDLRDGGSEQGGFGVQGALRGIREVIEPALTGMNALDQEAVDAMLIELDGTPNKARLGGNATIATSIAVLQAAADFERLPLWRYLAGDAPVRLPLPEIQIFGGGAHAGRRIDIQDFLVMPLGAASFDEALYMVSDVYRAAGDLMASLGKRSGVADEGGWWPEFTTNEEPLELLTRAIERAGYRHDQVAISLDIAASEFRRDGRYHLAVEQRDYDTAEWIEIMDGWIRRYPIASVEDPVAEDDAEGMRAFTALVGDTVQVIGDDFLVTSAARVRAAAAQGQCNAVLLKPNQAGTITETRRTMEIAKALGWGMIVSARSGETEDTTITHLATGWNTGQLKVGSFARSERMAKWNEGLRIEEQIGAGATFAGWAALPMRSVA